MLPRCFPKTLAALAKAWRNLVKSPFAATVVGTRAESSGEEIYDTGFQIIHRTGHLYRAIRLHFSEHGLSLRMSAIVISTFLRATASTNA
jgi:hypothetical protein